MRRLLPLLLALPLACTPVSPEPDPVPLDDPEDGRGPAGVGEAEGLDLFDPPPPVEAGECLGSVYGDAPIIDPDDPDYSDEDWTAEQVAMLFAEARAADTDAYRAYLAAFTWPDLVECGFCACGCHEAVGHLSAADCFKDFHGFYCGYCQRIALRTGELVELGLTDAEVRARLKEEFPAP